MSLSCSSASPFVLSIAVVLPLVTLLCLLTKSTIAFAPISQGWSGAASGSNSRLMTAAMDAMGFRTPSQQYHSCSISQPSSSSTSFMVSDRAIGSSYFAASSSRRRAQRASSLAAASSSSTISAPARSSSTSSSRRRSPSSSSLQMLWSGGRKTQGDEVTVNIERVTMNSRRISGSIVIDKPIDQVWLLLSDYNSLADFVPNLVQSKQIEHPNGGIRLFQEGAQNIIGFDFKASLTMDMEEHYADPSNRLGMRKIKFKIADSFMFSEFDGEWRMQFNSRKVNKNAKPGEDKFIYTTKLFYMLLIKPKGPVPVLALEWQISSEVPNNLKGLKNAAEGKDEEYYRRRRAEMRARTLRTGISVNSEMMGAAEVMEQYDMFSEDEGAAPMLPDDVMETTSGDDVGNNGSGGGARSAPEPVLAALRGKQQLQQQRQQAAKPRLASGVTLRADWESDETLEAYIAKVKANN